MPKQQLKTRVFGVNETLDDLTAEQEELGDPATPSPEPAPPPPPPAETPPAPASPEAPESDEPLTDKQLSAEARTGRRIRELVDEAKAKDRQIAEYREQFARLDERRKQLQEAQGAAHQAAQQQREAAERPDPSIDPVGARLYDIQKQNQELLAWKQNQEQVLSQLNQQFQASQQNNNFNSWIVAEAQRYTNTQPDYPQAVEYLGQQRIKFWMDAGYPEQQARQLVMSEAVAVANGSFQSGRSFPDIFYNLSKQWGWKGANGNGNGAPTSQAVSNAARTLNQVRNGQAMQGLSRVPAAGGSPGSRYREMTAAEISAVPERQWQRDWANPALRPDMEIALRKLDGLDDQDISYQGRS